MLDTLLNVGSAFDWITPTAAFIQDFFEGPVSDFGIPVTAGLGPKDIKHMLERKGLRVWGLMLNPNGDTLMFTVPKNQARWAHYLLKQEGVPLLYSPVEATISSAGTGTRKDKHSGLLDTAFGFLDDLLDP